jgi:glycosyltransferase involved in cell wall biosynthesis
MLKIGFVCPVYNAQVLDSYTRIALRSFFETTPGGVAIVVDDASSTWTPAYQESLRSIAADYDHAEIHFKCFPKAGGLTRSWNAGLAIADQLKLDYAIAGNNDVIFTAKWYEGLVHALANGYSLAGPLSNAPGITARGKQEVSKYVSAFELTDNRDKLDDTAAELRARHLGKVIESVVNGFFQMAKMEDWRRGKFNSQHYYRPANTHTSKGLRNPTPLMTLNEDELQGRWTRQGMKSAISLSSFIFHYRAVSRGDKYKRGNWYRQK